MSVNYVIKLLSHEHKNARSDANTERTDPQIFSDINCKHLGLIVPYYLTLILAGNLMCA